MRLPKSPDDPAYADAYKRVVEFGAPKDASAYAFDGVKHKDGSAILEEDAAFVRELASELKLPVNAAASVAQKIVERAERVVGEADEKKLLTLTAEQTALRGAWGTNYELNLFRTMRVAEALGWDRGMVDKLKEVVGGSSVMNALLQLAGKMDEAPLLKGEPNTGSGSLTREQAMAKKETLKGDTEWVKRYLKGGSAEIEMMGDLDRVILGGRR